MSQQPPVGHGPLIIGASRSHSDTPHSVGLLRSSDQPDEQICTWKTHNTRKRQKSMPEAGFKPTIPASEWPHSHAFRPPGLAIYDGMVRNSVWSYGPYFCMNMIRISVWSCVEFCMTVWWSGLLYDVWCGPLYEFVVWISIVSEKLSFLRKPIHSHTNTHWKDRKWPDIVSITYSETLKSHSPSTYTAANDRKHDKMLKIAQPTPPLNTSKQMKHFFLDDPVHAHLPLLSSLPPGAANLSLYALKSLPSDESRVLTYSSLLCRSHGSPDCVSDSVLPSKTSTLHNDVTQTVLTVLPWIMKRSISRYRKLPKLHHCTL